MTARARNPKSYEHPESAKIYGQLLRIEAKKTQAHKCDSGCARVDHCYYHDFSPGATITGLPDGAAILLPDGRKISLPDGSLLIKNPRS